MAYIVIEINSSNYSISDLNARSGNADSTNPHNAVSSLEDLISSLAGGASNGTVKVVTKDVATTINTSGSGSTSTVYNLA